MIGVFGRPLTLSPVEVSVWNLLTMKCFSFFIVLKLIADCSRVGLVIPKTLATPGLPCFYSRGRLTQTCPAILTATIRPLLFGNEIRKNLFVVARSLASIQ